MALSQGELCLCQLIELLGLAPSTVSKHLSLLQQAGLVERRKEGRWHFYRLAGQDAAPSVRQALVWTLECLGDEPSTRRDRARLEVLRKRDLEELSTCYRS
jgi:DNA-binding transcriptional ArsR family regulator